MSASVHRIGSWPVDDKDARLVIGQALSHASSLTFEVGPRTFDFTLQSSPGDARLEVTVHHADAPDDDPGAHYWLTPTRLAWCDDHRRSYPHADRLCVECVCESMAGDE